MGDYDDYMDDFLEDDDPYGLLDGAYDDDDEDFIDFDDDIDGAFHFHGLQQQLQLLHMFTRKSVKDHRAPASYSKKYPSANLNNLQGTIFQSAAQIFGPKAARFVNRECEVNLPIKKFTYVLRFHFTERNGDQDTIKEGLSKKTFYAHPQIVDSKIPRNIALNKMFFAVGMPAGFITKLVNCNWHFYVKNICIHGSTLERQELFDLCAYGGEINRFSVNQSCVKTRVMISDLAYFLHRATYIDMDIDGIGFDENWIKYFTSYDGGRHHVVELTLFRIRKARLNFSLPDWVTFMKRVSARGDVHLFLDMDQFVKYKVKTVITNVVNFFKESYTHVTKDKFDDLDGNEKFMITIKTKRTEREGSSKGIYFALNDVLG